MDNKSAFIRGALILSAANVISKILGAVFKIPLTYILREEGMAVFATATSVYSIFLTLVTAGVPMSAARLVAADTALSRHGDALGVVRVCSVILNLSGAAASVLLFFMSDFLAAAMKDPQAALAIKILSPSVFFVARGAAYKSYFQGRGEMSPVAASQITEGVVRLLAGFFGAVCFSCAAPGITAAAAISGVCIGELFATLVLNAAYRFKRRKIRAESEKSFKTIYSSIMAVAVPMLICSIMLSLLNMADTATVRNALLDIRFSPREARAFLLKYSQHTALFDTLPSLLRLSSDGARWLYGAYSGYALTVFHLPLGMIGTLSVSLMPIIAGSAAKKNSKTICRACNSALGLSIFCALPFSVFFSLASKDILFLLFHNTASADMLSLVSPCLVFLCISQLFTAVFHAAGRIYEPFLIQSVGIFIKLILNVLLIRLPRLNIDGAIISALVSFFVTSVLMMGAARRRFSLALDVRAVVFPIISAIAMWLVLRLSLEPLKILLKNRYAALFAAAFVSGISYLLCMSALSPGGIRALFKFDENKI